jgi:hypothetical protein
VIEELAITEDGSTRLGALRLAFFNEFRLTVGESFGLALDLAFGVGFTLA